MAVLVPLKGGGRTLGGALDYAEKNKLDGTKNLTRGVNCSDDKKIALAEMKATKALWNQKGGRQYKAYVISFPTGEVAPEQALDHTEKFCQTAFPTNESFLGCHVDTDNIHIHIIVNSVDFESGQKLHLAKYELDNFRDISDNLCRDMGLSVIEHRTIPLEEETIRTKSRQEYEVLKNAIEKNDGSSYKLNLRKDIKATLEKVAGQGFGSFKTEMERLGIDYKMSGDKKPKILFRYKNSHPNVRFADGGNLAKTFSDPSLTRENITKTLNSKEKISVNANIQPLNFAEQKYIECATKHGRDNNSIARNMLRSNIDKTVVIKTLSQMAIGKPAMSDEARTWATRIVRQGERDNKQHDSISTGGGRGGGRGDSERTKARTIDKDSGSALGGLNVALGGGDIEEIAENIAYVRGCTVDEAKSMMGIEE